MQRPGGLLALHPGSLEAAAAARTRYGGAVERRRWKRAGAALRRALEQLHEAKAAPVGGHPAAAAAAGRGRLPGASRGLRRGRRLPVAAGSRQLRHRQATETGEHICLAGCAAGRHRRRIMPLLFCGRRPRLPLCMAAAPPESRQLTCPLKKVGGAKLSVEALRGRSFCCLVRRMATQVRRFAAASSGAGERGGGRTVRCPGESRADGEQAVGARGGAGNRRLRRLLAGGQVLAAAARRAAVVVPAARGGAASGPCAAARHCRVCGRRCLLRHHARTAML